jgi:NitT/TauT family transport system substrate-binding protein
MWRIRLRGRPGFLLTILRRRSIMKRAMWVLSIAVMLSFGMQIIGASWAAEIPQKYWDAAAKRGKPVGKYGKPGEPITITVGYQPYVTPYWTSTINKQLSLWQKYLPEGSRVIWFRSLQGPLINANMIAGKNQIGYMECTPAMRSGDTVPCDYLAVTGYDLGQNTAIMVRQDLLDSGAIKGPKDLEGKSMAVGKGTYAHRHLMVCQKHYGFKSTDHDQGPEVALSNLAGKNIEAIDMWEPYFGVGEIRGVGKRILYGREHPCSCFISNKEFYDKVPHSFYLMGATLFIHDLIRDRPDVVVGWLKAEEEARELLNNRIELAAWLIWSDIPEMPARAVRATLEEMVWDGRLTANNKGHLKGVARLWREEKIIRGDRTKDPDAYIEEYCNPAFLDIAMDELQAQGRWTSRLLPGFPNAVRKDQLEKPVHWSKWPEDYQPAGGEAWTPGKYKY